MSNILKITTPNAGYESPNQGKTTAARNISASVQGAIQPEKITKPDARNNSASQEQAIGRHHRYNSNFETFIQQLRNSPSLTESFSTLFFERLNMVVTSGLNDEFSQKFMALFDSIPTNSENLAEFLKEQLQSSSRFQGAFFGLLRQAMSNTTSTELKFAALEFMKKYVDMSESSHILKQMDHHLAQMEKHMFSPQSTHLNTLRQELSQLTQGQSTSSEEAVALLKERILPHLNNYISSTHDRSTFRDETALLAGFIARYENGLPDRVVTAFEALLKFQGMQSFFHGFESEYLLQVLQNTEYEKTIKKQSWMQHFTEIIEDGLKGKAGIENTPIFHNLMQSILLNESVYMPLLHVMLPLQSGDSYLLSEMWIDPDAGSSKGKDSDEQMIQGLLKFDVKDLGFFDLLFFYQDGKMRMQLSCPPELKEDLNQIRSDISNILNVNQIRPEELFVESSKSSIPLSTVFPQIFERRNSVNVKI